MHSEQLASIDVAGQASDSVTHRCDHRQTNPELAEALALVQTDPELSQWLEEHNARQNALRAKFRQIAIPAGLKEQIISEQAAREKAATRRQKIVGVEAVTVLVATLISIGVMLWPAPQPPPIPNTLASFQGIMVDAAKSGYYMQLMTNADDVHSFLAKNQAPTNYILPAGLQKATLVGCAVEGWQGTNASLVCFRTGKPLAPGAQSDLWLFVVDRTTIKDASSVTTPQFAEVNGLITATWTQGDKLYMLTTQGDEQAIRKYL